MKIVDLTEFYSERGGGVRSHLTTKGHHLCHLGFDHLVIAPGPTDLETVLCRDVGTGSGGAGGISRILRIKGPALPYDPTYHLLARLDNVRAAIIREQPDVLEIHSPYLAMAGSWTVNPSHARVRTFFWHADFIDTYLRVLAADHLPKRFGDFTMDALWSGVRRLLGTVDATFVASRTQEAKLQGHGIVNTRLVPFGVDKAVFKPTADRAVRQPGSGGKRPLSLVAVGRFAVEKRWDVLLQALRLLDVPWELTLFGDGPERTKLERLADGLPVRFAGFEKDRAVLARALGEADLLVHTCPYETFGLGVAEAMSVGLPVVVPDEGGAFEAAIASSAESYKSLDPEACAAAIVRILARDPATLRTSALENSEKVLSVADHFRGMIGHYDELLGRTPVRQV